MSIEPTNMAGSLTYLGFLAATPDRNCCVSNICSLEWWGIVGANRLAKSNHTGWFPKYGHPQVPLR